MPKTVNIRNIPEKVHRKLKSRAKKAGMSVSAYVLKELTEVLQRPTLEEMRARLESREPVDLEVHAAEIIRAERDVGER